MSLPDRITRVSHVLEFFKPRPNDEKEEYPPLHKITNLYGMLYYTCMYVCMYVCMYGWMDGCTVFTQIVAAHRIVAFLDARSVSAKGKSCSQIVAIVDLVRSLNSCGRTVNRYNVMFMTSV